jgi:superfamily II DNA/RNA helicase
MLKNPQKVAITPEATTVERIDQRIIHLDRGAKQDVLAEILRAEPINRALVFTRTKHGADKVVRALEKSGISAEAIHGNKSQGQRERVLAAFRDGKVRTLVATDIAARGIDVEGISHVINFDLPNIPETYVHRIGRTARAGADGVAISFCSSDEAAFLRDIEKLIRMTIPSSDRRTDRRPVQPVSHQRHGEGARNHSGKAQRHRQRPAYPGNGRGRPAHQANANRPPQHANGGDRPPTQPDKIGGVAFMQRQPARQGEKSRADVTRAPR